MHGEPTLNVSRDFMYDKTGKAYRRTSIADPIGKNGDALRQILRESASTQTEPWDALLYPTTEDSNATTVILLKRLTAKILQTDTVDLNNLLL
jgi:hypothetical protein